jgi:hypothetical protein
LKTHTALTLLSLWALSLHPLWTAAADTSPPASTPEAKTSPSTPTSPDAPQAPTSETSVTPKPAIDFNDYMLSLFVQDMLLHRGKNASKIFNDNKSQEISQSAIVKRFALRYKIFDGFDVGASIQLSLRDEATIVDGVSTDIYHPFKAASLLSGYMLWSIPLSRVRIEHWINLRLNFALSERIVTKSTLLADTEFILAFNGDALVTFGIDISANIDDGIFYATQYGIGWRF